MEEMQIVNLDHTEITKWNFEQIKSSLEKQLEIYKNMVYTDSSIKSAKDDRTALNKAKKMIEDRRKAYKAKCLEPYDALEPQIKELVSMIEAQRVLIDETVKDFENRQKQEKEIEVRKYYDKKAHVLGTMAEPLYVKLLDQKWLNASTAKGKYEEGIQTVINHTLNEINTIKQMDSPFVDTLMETYVETLSLNAVKAKNEELLASVNKAGMMQTAEVEKKPEQKVEAPKNTEEGITLKIYASQSQMNQICDFMKAIGAAYEVQ